MGVFKPPLAWIFNTLLTIYLQIKNKMETMSNILNSTIGKFFGKVVSIEREKRLELTNRHKMY